MKPTTSAKRARVTTDAAPRAPTYKELEAENERLRQRVQELEEKLAAAVEASEPEATDDDSVDSKGRIKDYVQDRTGEEQENAYWMG